MQGQELVAKIGSTINRAVYTSTGGSLIAGTLPGSCGWYWSGNICFRGSLNRKWNWSCIYESYYK